MIRISGINREKKKHHWMNSESAADEQSLVAYMRDIAVEFQRTGLNRLKLPQREEYRLQKALHEMRKIDDLSMDSGELLKRFLQDRRIIESCVQQAVLDGGIKLPADSNGELRIEWIADAMCAQGEMRLDKERLLQALGAFDDVQALTMDELWAMPEALRVSLSKGFIRIAEEVLRIGRLRMQAEKWIGDINQKPDASPAFVERAMQIAAEQDIPEARKQLERCFEGNNVSLNEVIRQAHEQQARILLKLENLMANKRLIDGLDWQECFDRISAVERELGFDPADIYADMADQSRASVRHEIADIAQRLKLGELTVARYAINAARRAQQEKDNLRSTVCYWLMTDEGRKALLKNMDSGNQKIPRMIPDPEGKWCTAIIAALSLALTGLWMVWIDDWRLWFPGIPVAWMAANSLIGKFYPKIFPPTRLLRMKIDRLPKEWRTLVVMPVLLSDVKRAEEICAQMEEMGCLEKDPNIRFLLLGDFGDSDLEHQPEDVKIVDTARRHIDRMNRKAGEEKYFYLHRPRRWLAADKRWMGFDRKRGALMDLNRLIMGEEGAEDAFTVEGAACDELKRGFAYVVTLDADTLFLPGTVQELIGAMVHPLNRAENGGFAVLQPSMEMIPSACVNQFVNLFAGSGGVNTYPVSISNFWQDMTGRGIFAGKGIYDVKAFYSALKDALPEGRILSHDLIEGIIAGAGFAGDISFYDGYPASLSSVLKRLNRWTRGDWQLIPFLFSSRNFVKGKRICCADRVKLFDNLMRSLYAPALLTALIGAVWMGSGNALLAALLAAYLNPLLSIFGPDRLKWRRATAELAVLPAMAWCVLDAILRTVWRLAFSGKHLLDWVTAADAEKSSGRIRLPGHIAAILLAPGLFVPGWVPGTLALMALFVVGNGWVSDMEKEDIAGEKSLSSREISLFSSLARDTWHFFEIWVPMEGYGLPPDNVQIDPPAGAACRTSPTNIGLYLMSCLAANRMGFIRREEMLARMGVTVDTLQRMEKWQGHFYNWYDINDLHPLPPRYVSSVDSGNLAAALMLCSAGIDDEPLSNRMREMARAMDFAVLYDEKRDLFFIGMDADSNRPSASHYDLLASESRILSYTAMILGQIPLKHWKKLSRPCASVGDKNVLVSWSGTMFEYLMPEIFMMSPVKSLLGESNRTAIQVQQKMGMDKKRPWGVSESGYYAFDARLNYQYRAFGVRRLAMGGSTVEDVAAPYACILAVNIDPVGTAKNYETMKNMGWTDEFGLYEAADYLNENEERKPALVKSHMAHHQGMILCALCNALEDGALADAFMKNPEARALKLLLQEKTLPGVRLMSGRKVKPSGEFRKEGRTSRQARPERRLVETHLLYGGEGMALLTSDGAVHYMKNGIYATRFDGDFLNRTDGASLHYRDAVSGKGGIVGGEGWRTVFDAGVGVFRGEIQKVQMEMKICVSPEDGSLIRSIALHNQGETPSEIILTDVAPVALAPAEDLRAHPIFRNLFVESERISNNVVLFRRRSRENGEHSPVLTHMAAGFDSVDCETDYEKLVGRMGSVQQAGEFREEMTNTVGTILNPVSALQGRINLAPGEKKQVLFAMNLMSDAMNSEKWMQKYIAEAADQAIQLASAQARAMLGFMGIKSDRYHLLQRSAAFFFDGRLASEAKGNHCPGNGISRSKLWEMGVSGDLPIILVNLTFRQNESIHDIIRAHEFYHSMGIKADLIFIDAFSGDYDQPARDALTAQIAASHLSGQQSHPGGVWILNDAKLTKEQREALQRGASMVFSGEMDFNKQLRRMLQTLERKQISEITIMNPGKCTLEPEKRELENGYGGFLPEGVYSMDILPDRTTPAPWSNILANDAGGILLTERGGGFAWHRNSRNGRLTGFKNDALSEGWGLMFYLYCPRTRETLRLLPGKRPQMPFRVGYAGETAEYAFANERLSGRLSFCMNGEKLEILACVELENHGLAEEKYLLIGFVDWLMGTDWQDAAWLNVWNDGSACFASGTAEGTGYFAANNVNVHIGPGRAAFLGKGTIMNPEGMDASERSGGWTLNIPVKLKRNKRITADFALGWAENPDEARKRSREIGKTKENIHAVMEHQWREKMDNLRITTPDPAINHMANGFLSHQILTSRICGRTGLYQPGGAYGFRDQLQDMLAMLHFEPDRVRAHLLRCAAHQFEDGDVMHWWHEPWLGVRTKISDDSLFLPWVAAAYVKNTGDYEVLDERIAYLENVKIPDGKEDIFQEMHPGNTAGSLHDHCMRAFQRASNTGEHGLALMGSGDWNDGMNRVGHEGRGESIWLSEFLSACAAAYAEITENEGDRAWLYALRDRMIAAIEEYGWDGAWYLRAYMDSGKKLGGRECEACRIDAISQAWAIMAGLDEKRCAEAMDNAWEMLADQRLDIIRLLTPPFDKGSVDPGYIKGYPPGVRENGAQYTHGACWLLLALIHQGYEKRAHQALKMLLPTSHSYNPESAETYRVEPYVMAADVYSAPPNEGRGGWTWYTGAAGWMYGCILAMLGYERRENRVRLSPLLGEWPEAKLEVKFGNSRYCLASHRGIGYITLDGKRIEDEYIEMEDDGREHIAFFPPRDADISDSSKELSGNRISV